MKKSISKVLTLILSFAMVFTSIGWIGASEVNAAVDDFNNVQKEVWDQYGINYTDIDLTKDFIVDVRHTDSSVSPSPEVPFVDFAKDPHFVNSNDQCADVTGGVVAAGSAQANKLDELFKKAGDKRLVIICYGGMTMAKRAMQHFNAKGDVALGPEGKVTYLIGGSGDVLNGEYKYNLGIGFDEIASHDVILDVRSKENFDKGHLPGAVHVDVTDEDGNLSSKDKTDMSAALAKVPNGAKLVIVCNSGRSLAFKAMAYFMADKTSLKKVSYLIGGDKVVPADKKVTTDEENKPAPASAIKDGQTATVGGNTYKVTSASAKSAAFTKANKSKKSATVPATVTVNGVKLNVTSIAPKAFKGTKVKTLTVKSKKLTKGSVKGSLKGSKVKTVKVKVGKKKENKKYVKKYKKIFTKKNAGKKVKVK